MKTTRMRMNTIEIIDNRAVVVEMTPQGIDRYFRESTVRAASGRHTKGLVGNILHMYSLHRYTQDMGVLFAAGIEIECVADIERVIGHEFTGDACLGPYVINDSVVLNGVGIWVTRGVNQQSINVNCTSR